MDNQELLRAISGMMDEKLDAWIGRRFDGIDERFDAMEKRLDGMDERFDAMEKRQDGMELRLEKVESYCSALRHGQIEIHKELKKLSDRVESTYKIALDAWGQSTENRNLLKASL